MSRFTAVELLKEWDEDENGTVDKKEVRRVLPALGVHYEASTCDALFEALLEEVLEAKSEAAGRKSISGKSGELDAEAEKEIDHWDLFRALQDDMNAEQVEEAEANAKWEVANKSTRHEDGGSWHREASNRHALRKRKGPLRTSQNTVGGGASFQDGLGSIGRERYDNEGEYVDGVELGLPSVAGITLDSSVSIEEQIARALQNRMTRVMDLFKAWDESGDGQISPKEFRRAMSSIGVRASKEELNSVFASWDPDGNGSIEFDEMSAIIKRVTRESKEKRAAAEAYENQDDEMKLRRLLSAKGGDASGEGEPSLWRRNSTKVALGTLLVDAKSPIDQLREEILGKGTALIKLFRSWDVDRDGKVSKREFRDAVVMICKAMDTAVIDGLFKKLDPDSSGKIEYSELDKILRKDLHDDAAALNPAKARKLFPRDCFVYVFGPPAKEKKTLCKKLAYTFHGTWLTQDFLVERELETPGSRLSPDIRKLQQEFKPLSNRLVRALYRRATQELKGPFFLFDLPCDARQMESFEREFGFARIALELKVEEWKGEEENLEALTKSYWEQGQVLQLDAADKVADLVKKVENYMTVQARREQIVTWRGPRTYGLVGDHRCLWARAQAGAPSRHHVGMRPLP